MHLFNIPQCTIQNRNVHISVLNGALWDMEQVHCRICEIGLYMDHMHILLDVQNEAYIFQWQKCSHLYRTCVNVKAL